MLLMAKEALSIAYAISGNPMDWPPAGGLTPIAGRVPAGRRRDYRLILSGVFSIMILMKIAHGRSRIRDAVPVSFHE